MYLLIMNKKLLTLIRLFWQGRLSKEFREELLSELTDKQEDLRKDLEHEFSKNQGKEELHHDQDYQLYLREILEKTGTDHTTDHRVRLLWKKWVIAACLLVISGLGYVMMQQKSESNDFERTASRQEMVSDTTVIQNQSERVKRFTLADGSEVELSPGSRIAHRTDYGQENRSLQLTGEAKFTVTLDSIRPFVVEASGYTTTALGTSFIVDARHINKVNVRLLTGKVVVRSMPEAVYAIADQYLTPGEELAIRVDQLMLEKRSDLVENALTKIAQKYTTLKPEVNVPKTANLQFVETPLSEVFKQISATKQIQLSYEDDRMQALYFTGEFSEGDDLETILDIITMMNDLNYERQPDRSVKISKREP